MPRAPGLRLGLLTLPPIGDADFQTGASHFAARDRNLHSLKITSRSRPLPLSTISPAPSEFYPFVFFTLRDHSNESVTRSI